MYDLQQVFFSADGRARTKAQIDQREDCFILKEGAVYSRAPCGGCSVPCTELDGMQATTTATCFPPMALFREHILYTLMVFLSIDLGGGLPATLAMSTS